MKIHHILNPRKPRLFYEKATGRVDGTATGGGGLLDYDGDELIQQTFCRRKNPENEFGVIEHFKRPLGMERTLRECRIDVGGRGDNYYPQAISEFQGILQGIADFVYVQGMTIFGQKPKNAIKFREMLDIAIYHNAEKRTEDQIKALRGVRDDLDSMITKAKAARKDLSETQAKMLVSVVKH